MQNRAIRLAIVVVDLRGGTGVFCRSLVEGLKQFFPGQFHFTLVTLRKLGFRPTDETLFDHTWVLNSALHTNWRRFLEVAAHLWRLRVRIGACDPDLIFTIATYSNLLVPMAMPRQRIVLSEHLNMSHRLRYAPFSRIIRQLMGWIYPRYLVIGPAQAVSADLRANFAVRRAVTVAHGIDAQRIRTRGAEPAEGIPGSPYLLAVGRLAVQKDYPTMLRAYATAVSRGLAEHLLILGDGPESEALVRQLNLGQRVHMLGHRDNPFPYMRCARCFVLSSIFEGFGLVLLEAMALGVPCISTDCPSGPAEILSDGQDGILVPVGDIDKLADAMLRLTSNQALRDDLSARSLRRAEELSLQRMAAAYRDLFLAELGRSP